MVETASRLIVHAINVLDLSVFRADSGKAVSLISCLSSNAELTGMAVDVYVLYKELSSTGCMNQ